MVATHGRPMRADARRNYERLLAAADAEIARCGADASLEEIARKAGVGSATLHRHFPSRRALLDAVFHDRVEVLCARAFALVEDAEPGRALADWLRDVAVHAATTRGLARSMLTSVLDPMPESDGACEVMFARAGGVLLARAREAGAVRPEVSIVDLLTLANAVSLAVEGSPDAATDAARLVTLTIEGIRT